MASEDFVVRCQIVCLLQDIGGTESTTAENNFLRRQPREALRSSPAGCDTEVEKERVETNRGMSLQVDTSCCPLHRRLCPEPRSHIRTAT